MATIPESMFSCTRLNCRMSQEDCIRRQRSGAGSISCKDCIQGRQHEKLYGTDVKDRPVHRASPQYNPNRLELKAKVVDEINRRGLKMCEAIKEIGTQASVFYQPMKWSKAVISKVESWLADSADKDTGEPF